MSKAHNKKPTQLPKLSSFWRGTRTRQRCRARQAKPPAPWPPAELALPSTIEGIEAGRPEPRRLVPEQLDDSRSGRLARLTKHNPPGRCL
jgi:hypothetical protein